MKDREFQKFKWSYALSNGGGFMLVQATIASYFTIFLTDTFGIPAGIASVLMFVTTLFDAVKDPVIGAVVDRTQTRLGRYRPYFLIFPALYAVTTILLFMNPQGLSVTQKVIYIVVIYVLYGIFMSFSTTAAQAVLPAQTTDDKKRNQAVMLSITSVAISFTIASSFTTNFVSFFGGYTWLMVIYGILTVLAFFCLYKTSTERYLIPVSERSIWQDLGMLFKHKELFSVIVVWCLSSFGYGVMFSASTYYVLYYMARPDLISVYMLDVSMGALLSMAIAMPTALKLCKTVKKTLIVTQGILAGCYAVLLFAGKNLPVLFVLSFAASFIASMQQGLVGILLNDVIDYVQLKDGISLNGTLSSIKGFANKCGTAMTSMIILGVLAASGYIAGAIGQQPAAVTAAINGLRFSVPVLASIVVIICMLRYPVEPYYLEIAKMKEKMQ